MDRRPGWLVGFDASLPRHARNPRWPDKVKRKEGPVPFCDRVTAVTKAKCFSCCCWAAGLDLTRLDSIALRPRVQ